MTARTAQTALRTAIAAYVEDAAVCRVKHRADEWADEHPWFGSEDADGALEEAIAEGQIDEDEARAIARHIRRFRLQKYLLPYRGLLWKLLKNKLFEANGLRIKGLHALAQLGEIDPRSRALLKAQLRDFLLACEPAFRKAWEHSTEPAVCDLSQEVVMRSVAERFLAQTDDLAQEIVAWLGPETDDDLGLWCAQLCRGRVAKARPRDWVQRLAQGFAGLGLVDDLRRRVTVWPGTPGTGFQVAAPRPPSQVLIASSLEEWGGVSELQRAQALGAAWAHALVHPALPISQRAYAGAMVPDALGALLASWLASPRFVAQLGCSRREAESLARLVGGLWVLEARLWAACRLRAPDGTDVGREEIHFNIARALCVSSVTTLQWSLFLNEQAGRLEGRIRGGADFLRFRDRFDEDWYRNPRARLGVVGLAESGEGRVWEIPDEAEIELAVAHANGMFPS